MSKYEYQVGFVDTIAEAGPEDELTPECSAGGGEDYLSNLTSLEKYRMCREALMLERFHINNFRIIENGVPGEVKKYKFSFLIAHGEEVMLHLVSLGFSCPCTPGHVYLQQGPIPEIIYVNGLRTVATTPADEFSEKRR